MHNQSICISLDNTICTPESDIARCIPRAKVVKALKILKNHNNFIIIQTTRSIKHARLTLEWLRINEVPYDTIQFDKPEATLYIDDKAYTFESWDKIINEYTDGSLEKVYEDPVETYEKELEKIFFRMKVDGHVKSKFKRAMVAARKII